MSRKKKLPKLHGPATIGDLFAYLQKNTWRLRAVEEVNRNYRKNGWLVVYGTMYLEILDKTILADLGPRTKGDDAPYGR